MANYINANRLTPHQQYGITYEGAKVVPSYGIFEEKLKNGRVKFSDYVDPSKDGIDFDEVVLKPYGLKFFPYKGQAGGTRKRKVRKAKKIRRTRRN
jgi:hypothetical protein